MYRIIGLLKLTVSAGKKFQTFAVTYCKPLQGATPAILCPLLYIYTGLSLCRWQHRSVTIHYTQRAAEESDIRQSGFSRSFNGI